MKKWKHLLLGEKTSFDTKKYWENRYKKNGTSGSGSYGRLSLFKAEILNDFVERNSINEIIELGCGDGNQLKLARYPKYIGFDISQTAVELCRSKFSLDESKNFLNYNRLKDENFCAPLTISLDVIFHLVEDKRYEEYMSNLFNISSQYIIIYSSNYDRKSAEHVKSRNFSSWINENYSGKIELIKEIKNRYPYDPKCPTETSFSDFYIYKKFSYA